MSGVNNPADVSLLATAAALAIAGGNIDDIEIAAAAIDVDLERHDEHFHNRERWLGKLGVQTATDWGELASLTPYRAISGNGVFGVDANDEALVLGTADTPAIAGNTLFDMHRIMVEAASSANPFVLRIVYGAGTMADAETAGQYSDVMVTEARKGSPIPLRVIRLNVGVDKVWIRAKNAAKNAANNATIDFFVGLHEYAA